MKTSLDSETGDPCGRVLHGDELCRRTAARRRHLVAPAAPRPLPPPRPRRSRRRFPSIRRSRPGGSPNGLRYYIRANKKPEKRAELRLVVNAGSILEDDDQAGLAHFVEHMAFNGTKNFPEAGDREVPRVDRHAVRAERQRVHELRRDGLHAAGADRQAGGPRQGVSDPRRLGAQRVVRSGRDRQGARRHHRGVAAAARRRRAHAGQAVPGPAQGLALRRAAADRQHGGPPELQARAAEAVLHRLVPAGPDGGRRRRRLRQDRGRSAHQDSISGRFPKSPAAKLRPDVQRARPSRHACSRSPPTRKRSSHDASRSTASCRCATRRRSARIGSRWSNGCSPACSRRGSPRSRRNRTRRFSAPAQGAASSCARRKSRR